MEHKRNEQIGAEQWRMHITEQARSKQSIAAYCRNAGIKENSFYLWRKKVQQSSAPATGFEQIEVQRPSSDLIITTPNGYQVQSSDAGQCLAVAQQLSQC